MSTAPFSPAICDHPEYLAGIQAVKAAPDDDLPRLQLADWFEERGDPARGEFVRVQVELGHISPPKRVEFERGALLPDFDDVTVDDPFGREEAATRDAIVTTRPGQWAGRGDVIDLALPNGVTLTGTLVLDARFLAGYGRGTGQFELRVRLGNDTFKGRQRYNELKAHERELIGSHYYVWAPRLDGETGGSLDPAKPAVWIAVGGEARSSVRLEFRRGFVEDARLPADLWLAHGDRLAAACPLRRVELTTWPEFMGLMDYAGRRGVAALWPGVEFVLPPADDGLTSAEIEIRRWLD